MSSHALCVTNNLTHTLFLSLTHTHFEDRTRVGEREIYRDKVINHDGLELLGYFSARYLALRLLSCWHRHLHRHLGAWSFLFLIRKLSGVSMEEEDYYVILGLTSKVHGGAEASAAAIGKAFRVRALACHPDKRPDDPSAAAEFHKLQKAYEVLSDERARKAYDELLEVKKIRLEKESQQSSKRQKMMQDLRNREHAFNLQQQEKAAEERAAKRLQEEIARIRAMHAQKATSGIGFIPVDPELVKSPNRNVVKPPGGIQTLDKERMLKVSWLFIATGSSNYTAAQLKEVFQRFGKVEDVVIRPRTASKKCSALVVMGSRAEAVAATKSQCGDISNPLLVVPLLSQDNVSANKFTPQTPLDKTSRDTTSVDESLTTIGSGYHAYEDTILKKMQKKAEEARLRK